MEKGLKVATDNLDRLLQMATKVCKTQICPQQFKDKPNDALAAMLYGKELNFGPMQSLNCINIINGKASLSIDGLLGLAQAHPEWNGIETKQLGTKKDGKCSKDYGFQVSVSRMGKDGKPKSYTEKFDVSDAVRASLWGKGAWQNYPDRMLKIRAMGFALRTAFQDAIKGTIDTVEAQDYDHIPKRGQIKPPVGTIPGNLVTTTKKKQMINGGGDMVDFRPIKGKVQKMTLKEFGAKMEKTWQQIFDYPKLEQSEKLKKVDALNELNQDILQNHKTKYPKESEVLNDFYDRLIDSLEGNGR
jgi:hypothetical protein